MSYKLELKVTQPELFIEWIQRFSILDDKSKALLIEIDSDKFVSKSSDSVSGAVGKMSSISFDDAGMELISDIPDKRVNVALFNIDRFSKNIQQFNSEYTLIVEYVDVRLNEQQWKGEYYAATNVILKNKKLKMMSNCISLKPFKNISDVHFKTDICKPDGEIVQFELDSATFNKIIALSKMETTTKNDYISFTIKDNIIYAVHSTFELEIGEAISPDKSLALFKKQLYKLDKENYMVTMGDDRFVFASQSSNTFAVLSIANI